MLPFRKILFPVDFSEACRKIVPRVRETLSRFQADLLLVHSVDPLPLAVGPLEAPLFIPPAGDSEFFQRHQERLRQFAALHFPGEKPTFVTETGDAITVIENALRHHGADLVMMPTHGHGAIRRLLLGSVTAKVLHDVDCAVWTTVPGKEPEASGPYRHIVCALSLDQEDSEAVLRAAGSIARSYETGLSILHSVDLPESGLEFAYREAILAAADHKLRQLRERTGVKAPYELVVGSPVEQVRLAVLAHEAGLLVTGRGQAREAGSRVWSQLYSIIRESPCAVLSI